MNATLPSPRPAQPAEGNRPRPLPRFLLPSLTVLAAAGAAEFLVLLARMQAERAWKIFLVNLLFWPGAATGGVALAAIFQLSNARWAIPIRRLAHACAACLPLSFLLFLAAWFGRRAMFPWMNQPPSASSPWLNVSALFVRETAGLLLLYGTSLYFCYRSLTAEALVTPVMQPGDAPAPAYPAALQKWATALVIFYAAVSTVFAWDFIMSLQPGWASVRWGSSLLGGLYLTENLYLGLAAVAAMTAYARWRYRLEATLTQGIFRNLGLLVFSFCLLWIYLFWSQYLVIWYGNLPRETGFLLARTDQESWKLLSVSVLLMAFAVPFLILLSRPAKENPKVLVRVAVVIALGIWIERFLLVAPVLAPGPGIPLGWAETLISAGFFSFFALTYLWALHRILSR